MTGPIQHLPPEDEADLAALADGALYGPRRAALEARLADRPELAAALERQRAVVSLIARSSPPAPLSLRLLVEELEAAPPAPRRPRRLWPAAALALAATMAAFVVVLAGRGPAVDEVLAVALRPATAPATLDRPFEGVRFPSYEQWQATGERTDNVDGREVRTVTYRSGSREIAYAIVAGPALSGDERLREIRDGDRVAVTWTRDGLTCIIVARGGDAAALARLAVW
jgi:anti-sigma factor ChrR (cupin superfamily)